MAEHKTVVPAHIPVNHVLTLTEDEAYQIWLLSYSCETGGQLRVHNFFDAETRWRFTKRRETEIMKHG